MDEPSALGVEGRHLGATCKAQSYEEQGAHWQNVYNREGEQVCSGLRARGPDVGAGEGHPSGQFLP